MKKTIILISLTIFVGILFADWYQGDGHKMHYPQLPDPYGWDVNCTWPNIVADDWQCSETGPVEDVHIWVSWKEDAVADIIRVHLSIHDNIPNGPYGWSIPGEQLWEWDFYPGEFQVILYGTGEEGWFDPPEYYVSIDHYNYYQINITDIPDPWIQYQGEIYWLDVSIEIQAFENEEVGWKTSLDHWNDDSVYWDDNYMDWFELRDPIDPGTSLDQAFVITGEGEVPVELSSFTAFYHDGTPTLGWTTQTESNNMGWNVYRSETENFDDSFQANSNLIPGA